MESNNSDSDDYEYGPFGLSKPKVILLDTSFVQVEEDKITFSVNKVTPRKVTSFINAEKAFQNSMDQLSKWPKGKLGTSRFPGVKNIQDISIKREPEKSDLYVDHRVPATIGAIAYAFANHIHLNLSPSDFIILLGQGLATHITENSEKLRQQFVDHEGKEMIIISRPDIIINGGSDWSTIFDDFCQEIKKRVKKEVYDVVIDDTSVATKTTRIVSELNLMDCMKNYFDYVCIIGCGFPKITLKGTPDDWKKLLNKVEKLQELNGKSDNLELGWWLKNLIPVTRKICEAGIDRKVDHQFWSNMYQESMIYLSQSIRGWINAFLPYINSCGKYKRNYVLEKGVDENKYIYEDGISYDSIREGVSQVPFIAIQDDIPYKMIFYSGFLGARYIQKNDSIEPAYFWSVAEDPGEAAKVKKKKKKNLNKDEGRRRMETTIEKK